MTRRAGGPAIRAMAGLLFALASAPVAAQTYEAPLPAQMFTEPDLCRHAPCADVMPGADRFSMRTGSPPYVVAYTTKAGESREAGYVFLSSDIVDIPGYSGQQVVVLVGMDRQGRITGARVLRHVESILRLGIPEAELTRFVGQHVGKLAGEPMPVGKARAPDARTGRGLDAISGATVTAITLNQVISQSAVAIARQTGIIPPAARPRATWADVHDRPSWKAMVDEGSIQRLTVSAADAGATDTGVFIDIHFGYLNPPALGRSVLGTQAYDALMAALRPGEHAIFAVASGAASFKGSGFARGGIFERIQVAQDLDTFLFRDLDYMPLPAIEADGAPVFNESAVFIIRSPRFSAALPWRLLFLASTVDKASGTRTFFRFEKRYAVPARYLAGGRP